MKSKILILSVLIILPVLSYPQNAWHWQNLHPTSVNYSSSYFLDNEKGWIAGEGTIIRTTDGSLNWHIYSLSHGIRLTSVFFASSDFGIATGYDCFYKTYDGGNNWFNPIVGTFHPGQSKCFLVSESIGWIAGNALYKSTNGFITWNAQQTGSDQHLNDIYFLDSQTGWVTDNINLYKTTDGGNNWITIINPLLSSYVYEMQFVNENTGWIAADNFLKTTDGGFNWIDLTQLLLGDFQTFYFIDELTGWASVQSRIYRSTDGGNNWTFMNDLNNHINSVYFENDLKGTVSGVDGMIAVTENAGANWTRLDSGFKNDLRESFFLNSMTGWVSGDNGCVQKTTDGGNSWITQTTDFSSYLNSIFFVNEFTGWTAGTNLFKTTNGGVNWLLQIADANFQEMKSVYFISESTGWMAGMNEIYKTTDEGMNWILVLDNPAYDFTSIMFYDGSLGWVSDYNGRILKSTDGGNSWSVKTPSPGNYFTDIFFPDSAVGYAAATYHFSFYRSTDAGETWLGITSMYVPLTSLYFINVNTGWVTGSRGELYQTTDMGNSWRLQYTGTDIELNSVLFVSENTGWITGTTGLILKTTTGGFTPYTGCGIFGNDHLIQDFISVYTNSIGNGYWILDAEFTQAEIIRSDQDSCFIYSGSEFGRFTLKYYQDNQLICEKKVYIDIVLPVNLTEFTSTINGRNVVLSWTTASEVNNSGFEIQRKKYSREWIVCGFAKSSGNSQNITVYTFEDKNLSEGRYLYRLKQIDFNGNSRFYELSGDVIIGLPEKFSLSQNYPNPFNPKTIIDYSVPVGSRVVITVYDILGREINKLVNEYKDAGYHSVKFDGSNLASGVYFYTLSSDNLKITKRMLLIK